MLGDDGRRSGKLLELIGVRHGFLASSLDTFRAVAEHFHRHAHCSVEAIGFPRGAAKPTSEAVKGQVGGRPPMLD